MKLLLFFALSASAMAGIPGSFSSRGVGGGGALYSPVHNPVNANEVSIVCDMGHALLTTDNAQTWSPFDFRVLQARQTSAMCYCTDPGSGQHRLFTIDGRPGVDESTLSKPVTTAAFTSTLTAKGATFAKIFGWPDTRFCAQLFANPNRTDRVLALESNSGNSNQANVYVTVYDAANLRPKFNVSPALFSTGSSTLGAKARIAGVFFDEPYILMATNNGFYVSSDGGANFVPGPALPNDSSNNPRGFISMCGAKQGGQIRLYAVSGPPSAINITAQTNALSLTSNLVWHMDWSPTGTPAWVQDMTGIDNSGSLGPPADSGDYPNLIAMGPTDINTVYTACGRRFAFPDVETVYKKTSVGASWSRVFTAVNNPATFDNGNIEPGWLGFNTQPVSPVGGLTENGLGYNNPCGLAVNPADVNDVILTDNAFIHRTRNGGIDWHQQYNQPQTSVHTVGQKFPRGEDYETRGLDTTVWWWLDFAPNGSMSAGASDMKVMQSNDGINWHYGYDHTALWDDCYMIQTYTNATYPSLSGTRYLISEHTNSQYGFGCQLDSQVDSTISSGSPIPGVYYLPTGGTTPLTLKDSWEEGTGDGTGGVRGNPMWITVDAARDRLFVSVANSNPAVGGVWRGTGLHNGASNVVWKHLSAPTTFVSSRPAIFTQTRAFNVRVLDDHKLLMTYSCRQPGTPTQNLDYEASSGVFYSADDGDHWTDVSRPEMFYYTLDVVPDPSDPLNTWYACVWKTDPSKSTGSGSEPGGVWRTQNQGGSWTRIWNGDAANSIGGSTTSITINPDPQFPREAFISTRFGGLYFTNDVSASSVVWQQVTGYPFRAPTRVFYDPNHRERIWITSNGYGLSAAIRPGTFAEWQVHYFGAQANNPAIAGPGADPDGDGAPNQTEYALATDPFVANASPVNTVPYQNAGSYLSYRITKNPVASDVVWSAESSSDLLTWTSTSITVLQNDGNTFWAIDNNPIGSTARRFLRLKLTLGP